MLPKLVSEMTEAERLEWLEQYFECEYCAECGGDAEHHTVTSGPFGLPFAYCKHPATETGAASIIREYHRIQGNPEMVEWCDQLGGE